MLRCCKSHQPAMGKWDSAYVYSLTGSESYFPTNTQISGSASTRAVKLFHQPNSDHSNRLPHARTSRASVDRLAEKYTKTNLSVTSGAFFGTNLLDTSQTTKISEPTGAITRNLHPQTRQDPATSGASCTHRGSKYTDAKLSSISDLSFTHEI